MTAKQILVIEDDVHLSEFIGSLLEERGYRPRLFTSQKDFESSGIDANEFSGFLIDKTLPGEDGLDVVRNLKLKDVHGPILLVTGQLGAENIVQGLRVGADDYVTKPFDANVLIARLERLIERFDSLSGSTMVESNAYEGLKLDKSAYELVSGDQRARFTRTEFAILQPLFERIGAFIKREMLFEGDSSQKSRSLDVHIAAIRKKVRPFGLDIETLRGMGYRLNRVNRLS